MYLKYYNNIHNFNNLLEKDEKKGANLALKITSIVVFLAMATAFGLMPYFITKCRKSTKFLSVSNAFSGGLFLGIGLFHVLPESAEMLEGLSEAPIAYFCAFLSYALILFVEKVAFNSHALIHGHGHNHNDEEKRITLSKLNETNETDGENEDNEKKEPMVKTEMENKEEEFQVKEKEKSNNVEDDDHAHENKENDHENKEHDHENKEHDHSHEHKSSAITPYILLLALGFHGFFEGMALGIQSDVSNTLSLFLAIVAHKWAASLTLGISIVKSGVEKKQLIIMVLIFAFIGPVGVAVGLILSETANDYLQGIFLAISVGTFIYIACSEVLVEEFENPDNKFLKFFMFMVGGIFIGSLSLVELALDIEE